MLIHFPDYSSTSNACITQNGTSCILPFRYFGTLHDTCLTHPNGNHWCPTKVGNNMEFLFGSKYWGLCSLDCPILSSERSSTVSGYSKDEDVIEFETKQEAWKSK